MNQYHRASENAKCGKPPSQPPGQPTPMGKKPKGPIVKGSIPIFQMVQPKPGSQPPLAGQGGPGFPGPNPNP